MKREGYWDYMGRKLREDRQQMELVNAGDGPRDDMWKREIAEMQKQVHDLQMRVVDLGKTVDNLKQKVKLLGGDPNQTEMEFNAYI